jgi:hypothetical protein
VGAHALRIWLTTGHLTGGGRYARVRVETVDLMPALFGHCTHAHGHYAHSIHAHSIHAHSIHAHSIYAHSIYAHSIHAHSIHARCTRAIRRYAREFAL